MKFPMYIVDAFSSSEDPFSGNPAAVCVLSEARPSWWMQQVAAEMNLSETAFLQRRDNDSWDLRWFTPRCEVDLCGHATLAAAHVLWRELGDKRWDLNFHTRSGLLVASRAEELISLDLPADPPTALENIPDALIAAIGQPPVWVGMSRNFLLAVVDDARWVRELQPDMSLVESLPASGLIISAPGDEPGLDMVSRFFAPRIGVPEDPVTGAAHCVLAVYWSRRLGKNRLQAFQASKRTGQLGLEITGDRVYLLGRARTHLAGEFRV
jgi:PhzF family phenazine biosynthesis protein